MLCNHFLLNLKAFICFQVLFLVFLKGNFSLSQSIEPYAISHRADDVLDVYQTNDSTIVGLWYKSPYTLSQGFVSSIDSSTFDVFILNLKNQNLKNFLVIGNIDSMEVPLATSSFIHENEFYFTTRKMSRTNFIFGPFPNVNPPNTYKCLFKIANDTIVHISDLYSSIEGIDYNPFTFINLEDEIISIVALPNGGLSSWRLSKYNQNGTEIGLSDTLTSFLPTGIIQNPADSSYNIYFSNSSAQKLDKNLQFIGPPKYIRELNSMRWIELPYFTPKVDSNPVLSGILSATNVGDSLCISSGTIINDTVYVTNWKKLIQYELITPNYNNYVFNSQFNTDNFKDQFFYAYDKKQCFPGSSTCQSKFRVVKHDTLNNTLWDLEFGGDAGYLISKVVALRDSGCIVFVRRTDDDGEIDLYYVYIDKNGIVGNNFLPVLGGKELSIPVQVTFSIYPNPTTETLSLDNLQLEKKAKRVFILNYEGKIVQQALFQKTINVSELNSGNYIYRIETVNGQYYDTKFIKK